MLWLRSRELLTTLHFLRETYVLRDLDIFPGYVVSALQTVVPAEIISYNEVNPGRRRTTRLWHPPAPVSSELKRAFDRHIPEHPLIAYYGRSGDDRSSPNLAG